MGEEFLANIGTVNVARDLDIVRDALGDERLNFVGYSYGTHIGALYAHMYPGNTRAPVLDGAVATERSDAEAAVEQVAAFQSTWNLFVADCAAEAAGRHLGRLYDDTFGGYEGTGPGEAAPATGAPGRGRRVHRGELRRPRRSGGRGGLPGCLRRGGRHLADLRSRPGVGPAALRLLGRDRGGASRPHGPERAPDRGHRHSRRPRHPHSGAGDLADRLESAVLVTYEGGGHTVYGDGRSDCVDGAVDAYLLTGETPGPGSPARALVEAPS